MINLFFFLLKLLKFFWWINYWRFKCWNRYFFIILFCSFSCSLNLCTFEFDSLILLLRLLCYHWSQINSITSSVELIWALSKSMLSQESLSYWGLTTNFFLEKTRWLIFILNLKIRWCRKVKFKRFRGGRKNSPFKFAQA